MFTWLRGISCSNGQPAKGSQKRPSEKENTMSEPNSLSDFDTLRGSSENPSSGSCRGDDWDLRDRGSSSTMEATNTTTGETKTIDRD